MKSVATAKVPIQARVFRNAVIVFMGLSGLWGGWGCAFTSKVRFYPLVVTIRIQESPEGSHFHFLAPNGRLGERKLLQRKLPFAGGGKRQLASDDQANDRQANEMESRCGHSFPKPHFGNEETRSKKGGDSGGLPSSLEDFCSETAGSLPDIYPAHVNPTPEDLALLLEVAPCYGLEILRSSLSDLIHARGFRAFFLSFRLSISTKREKPIAK